LKIFLKWFLIVAASLVVILVFIVLSIFWAHDRYGFYPTGGQISELQQQYDAVFYDINLEVISEEQALKGFVNITIKSITDQLNTVELDLINNFDVSKIVANNQELQFEHDNHKLLITLTQPLTLNQLLELGIHYSGQPIEAIFPPWIGGFNWSKDKNENDWIGVSCQGEGGKVWFPSKSHPSDEPDSVAINITVPKPYYCAANGILQKISEPREGFQTYHWLTKYPTNNYNISINIAKYKILEKSYTSVDGNTIPVVYYYLTDSTQNAEMLVDMAIDMLKSLEKYCGEYPFAREKSAYAETSYLGMEHQTINSYGNNYILTKRQDFSFDWLMLHEMTHEWWGNKVTVRDWADFWIHEGIGTYCEALYVLDKTGEVGYHEHMEEKGKTITNEVPIIPKRLATSEESYTPDIYYKGCYFMHSLRFALGDSIFFKTLYKFATDSVYTYQNLVETKDFLELVNINSGKDYSSFFTFYLETTDLLNVVVDSVALGQWEISIPNIEFELPMELEINGELQKVILGNKPVLLQSESEIGVDPKRWYLHKVDFLN